MRAAFSRSRLITGAGHGRERVYRQMFSIGCAEGFVVG